MNSQSLLGAPWRLFASPKGRRLALQIVVFACVATGCSTGATVPPRPAPHPLADVTDYRGNLARTGRMPGPGLRSSGVVGWRWADQSAIGYPPTVTAGLVLVPENRSLIALGLASGTPEWSVSLGASTNAPITVAAGMVFVTTTDNVLHAIDLTTRQERWAMPGAADGAQVSVEGRTAYLGTQNQELIALDIASGTRRWSVDIGHSSAKNAIADGTAFVCGDNGSVLSAISLSERKVLWTFDTHSDRLATPSVDRHVVYVAGVAAAGLAGRNTNLFALDAMSGTEIWRFAPPNDPPMASFAVGASDIFIGLDTAPGTLYAVSRQTGRVHWQTPIAGAVDRPAIVDNVLYIAAGPGGLNAFDISTGRCLWTVPIAGYHEGAVISGGIALVATRAAPGVAGTITAVFGHNDPRAVTTTG